MLNKKLTKAKGCCIIKTKREDALINSLVMNVKSGFQGRPSEGKTYKQIKLKDVTKEGIILFDQLTEFEAQNVNERFFLKKNDIIFKAKCAENSAALIEEDLADTVATSHFLVLTVNNVNQVDPAYLAMYLNSDFAQSYFKINAQGVTVPMIRLSTLEELDVKLPTIEKQREVAKAYQLLKDEKVVMEQLIQNREKQFKAYLQNLLG